MIVRERLVLVMVLVILNIRNMMKVMNAWNTFKQKSSEVSGHFVSCGFPAVGFVRGGILEVTYISPEGEKLTTNIKVQASDLELLRELSGGN